MYCSKCGQQNQDGNLFCLKCGNKLSDFNNFNVVQNNVPLKPNGVNQGSVVPPTNASVVQNSVPLKPNSVNQGSVTPSTNASVVQNSVSQQPNSVNPGSVTPSTNASVVQNSVPLNPNGVNQGSVVPPTNASGVESKESIRSTHSNKKKNKAIIFVILSLVICLVALFAFLFFKNSNQGKRTIMIYMIGSNLESEGKMATLDIKEIESSGVSLEDNNIIVYAGGSEDWHNDFENNSIYELTSSGFELVKSDNKSSMGDAETLTRFLNYVYDNYKSDSYGLILWDHGAGPIIGYGVDETYDGDGLFLVELDEALANSKFSEKNKLEFIGFDACLMASAEIASILSEYSDYMVASQDVEPGYGWDYTFLKEVTSDVDTESLGKLIIDYTEDYYDELSQNNKYTFYITLSLLDLSKIDELEDKLNDLFEEVDIVLSNNGYSKIVSTITKAKSFGYAGYDKSYDLLDLGGISEQLSLEYGDKANELSKIIDDVVLYQKSNVAGTSGISIYYPYYTKSLLTEFLQIYETLDFAEGYTNFLNNYSKILSGKPLSSFSLKSLKPELTSNNEQISVSLSEDVAANYNNSNYIIFRDMKNGYYMPVYKSSDVNLNGTTLSANFDKKQLGVEDGSGEIGWATMLEYERNDSYVIYSIPILMYKMGDSLEGYEIDNANIQLLVDKENPNGTIVNVVPMNDVNDVSSVKKNIDLQDWDYIQFFNSEYKLYDENGKYTDDWESSGTYYLTEISTDDNYEISFIDLDYDYDYYCLFQVSDTQGNAYYTDLVKVN